MFLRCKQSQRKLQGEALHKDLQVTKINVKILLKEEKLGAQTTIGGKQFHGGMALTANDDKLAADLQTG